MSAREKSASARVYRLLAKGRGSTSCKRGMRCSRQKSEQPTVCVDQRAHGPLSGFNKIRTPNHSESAHCRPWFPTRSAAAPGPDPLLAEVSTTPICVAACELATVAAGRSQSNLPFASTSEPHVPESGFKKIRTPIHSESAHCRPWVLTSSAAKGDAFQSAAER